MFIFHSLFFYLFISDIIINKQSVIFNSCYLVLTLLCSDTFTLFVTVYLHSLFIILFIIHYSLFVYLVYSWVFPYVDLPHPFLPFSLLASCMADGVYALTFRGHCYVIQKQPTYWIGARNWCGENGARLRSDLVVIDDQDEMQFIKRKF